jgi:S1-C subfamily serine protease
MHTRIARLTTILSVTLLLVSTTGLAQQRQGGRQDQKPLSATQVFDRFAPRVVLLKTYDEKGNVIGLASGVLVSADGYVATNGHVVLDCSTVIAYVPKSTSGHIEFTGLRLLQYDSESDVAILKMDARNLLFFELASVAAPRVGEKVYAIGNPRGLENTISEGIVSGVREMGAVRYVQHSAPISPGSSGGALISERGILIGLNTFLLEKSQNLNFAIPVSLVRSALESAKVNGVALTFPKSKVPVAALPSTPNCYAPFSEGNYIGAITIANRIVADGKATTKEYGVIGMAYFELGKIADAETYLRQTLVLGTTDDPFKQTARYYLVRIYEKRMGDTASTDDRASLVELTRAFLNSKEHTLLKSEYDKGVLEMFRKLLLVLEDISGEWVDDEGQLYRLLVKSRYRIESAANGVYNISLLPHDQGNSDNRVKILYTLFGKFTQEGSGKLVGTVRCGILGTAVGERSMSATSATQDARVELTLSDDLSRLSGTVTFFNVEGSGTMYDLWRKSSPPRTVPLTLVRR